MIFDFLLFEWLLWKTKNQVIISGMVENHYFQKYHRYFGKIKKSCPFEIFIYSCTRFSSRGSGLVWKSLEDSFGFLSIMQFRHIVEKNLSCDRYLGALVIWYQSKGSSLFIIFSTIWFIKENGFVCLAFLLWWLTRAFL